jgi:hypothetical protein
LLKLRGPAIVDDAARTSNHPCPRLMPGSRVSAPGSEGGDGTGRVPAGPREC